MSSKRRESLFFRLLIVVSVAFLLTVLMLLASVLSPSQSPGARFLNQHAPRIIGIEVVLTVVLAIVAMATDRRPAAGTEPSGSEASTATDHPAAIDRPNTGGETAGSKSEA